MAARGASKGPRAIAKFTLADSWLLQSDTLL